MAGMQAADFNTHHNFSGAYIQFIREEQQPTVNPETK